MTGNDRVEIKLIHQLIASTQLDRDNEKLTYDQLKNLYHQMPDSMPMGQKHDASLPPIARQYNKSFEKTESGEYAIFVDIDVYDKQALEKYGGFSITYSTEKLTRFADLDPSLEIRYNPKYFSSDIANEMIEVSTEIFPINVIKIRQKAVETLPILFLNFPVAAYAAGFFGKAGADTYDYIKKKVIDLSAKCKQDTGKDTGIQIMFPYKDDKYDYRVLIHLSPEQLEIFELDDVNPESLHEFLVEVIGESMVKSVAIEMTSSPPYWKVLHIVDSDNKVISI